MALNVLDKAIALVAPGWGLSRARARMGIQAYQAAKPSRLHKAKRDRRSGDASVQQAARSLREQARVQEQDSDLVDGLLTTLTNNVVGRDGIGVEPMPLDRNGQVHAELAKALQDGFAEWSLKPESTGTFSRPELERLVCRTWLRDGECLGEEVLGAVDGFVHPNQRTPFSLQVMEPDFLPLDLDRPADNIVQGIERNPWGQAVRYHLYRQHPGGLRSFRLSTRPVMAERMLHIKLVKRLHQGRGVSILASALQRLTGLQNYEESELVAARIAAAMAFYIRKGNPDNFDNEADAGQPRRQIPISPGTVFDDLKPGEDVGTIESKRPNALMQTFRDTMLRMICSATGANFSTVAKKYDGTYSSQRQELVESYLSYGVLSNAFIAQWARPVYRRWVQMAVMTGQIKLPADLDADSLYNAYYQAPVMPWIDPAKEAKGHTETVKGGFGTEAEVIRSRGKNPAEVKRHRAREIDENRRLGLVFSSDPFHDYYGQRDAQKDRNAADRPEGDGDTDD